MGLLSGTAEQTRRLLERVMPRLGNRVGRKTFETDNTAMTGTMMVGQTARERVAARLESAAGRWGRRICIAAMVAGLILFGHAPTQLNAQSTSEPMTVDDVGTGPASTVVTVAVLDNDTPTGNWDPTTLRIVDPANFDTLLTEYVEPGQGLWSVFEGKILFAPCMGDGLPVPACTEMFKSDPYPIDYRVMDMQGNWSNPAHIEVNITTSTVPVTIGYVSVRREQGQVRIDWTTATETGNAGFNVWSDQDGDLVLVTESMIPSQVIDSLDPQSYVYWTDSDAVVFYIEEISVSGERGMHGPYEIGQTYGAPIDVDPIDLGGDDHGPVRIYIPLVR